MKANGSSMPRPKLTFWRAVFLAIVAAGAYATYVRFVRGLGASTHLSDAFPWGVWIGFDVLVGVGLAAGGFVISAVVHVFHVKRYEPMARPAVLTAFMGYLLVSTALAFDVGQPWRMWHPLVMWNPHSVMFEVAWCVMLYTSVLAIEFSPMVFERLGWQRPLRVVRALYTPFVILGVMLSMMHQSSLGTVFLIMPDKLHGLWYTPWLPVFFFLTAIAAGLGMTIVESHLSARAFGHKLDHKLLEGAARVLVVLLGVYALWKTEDLFGRGNLPLVFQFSQESVMFWGEMGLGVFLPMLLFAIPAVRRNPRGLFLGAVLTVMGFIVNRLNVSLTGMGAAGAHYFPSWMELAVTAAMVAVGFAGFALAVKYLAVFGHGEPAADTPAPAAAAPQLTTVSGRGLLALWGLLGVGVVLMFAAGQSNAANNAKASHGVSTTPRATGTPTELNEAATGTAAPALKLPDTFTFPTGTDSPGQVGFDHESHVGRLEGKTSLCGTCHQSQFSLRRSGQALTGAVTMERMKKGELCGACHDGKTAFAVDDCGSCHQ
jgi:c(7)-type cytochrome triheme protein